MDRKLATENKTPALVGWFNVTTKLLLQNQELQSYLGRMSTMNVRVFVRFYNKTKIRSRCHKS